MSKATVHSVPFNAASAPNSEHQKDTTTMARKSATMTAVAARAAQSKTDKAKTKTTAVAIKPEEFIKGNGPLTMDQALVVLQAPVVVKDDEGNEVSAPRAEAVLKQADKAGRAGAAFINAEDLQRECYALGVVLFEQVKDADDTVTYPGVAKLVNVLGTGPAKNPRAFIKAACGIESNDDAARTRITIILNAIKTKGKKYARKHAVVEMVDGKETSTPLPFPGGSQARGREGEEGEEPDKVSMRANLPMVRKNEQGNPEFVKNNKGEQRLQFTTVMAEDALQGRFKGMQWPEVRSRFVNALFGGLPLNVLKQVDDDIHELMKRKAQAEGSRLVRGGARD